VDRASLKFRALRTIEAERAEWQRLVQEVGDRVEQPGITGQWSFKDVTAHLLGWRSQSLDKIEAAANGLPEPPTPWPAELTSDDEINAWIDRQQRDRSASDVLTGFDGTFERFRRLVETLPEEDLRNPNRFPSLDGSALGDSIISGRFFGHLHDEHEPDIRRWLSDTSLAA
jgi:hypothetical protein